MISMAVLGQICAMEGQCLAYYVEKGSCADAEAVQRGSWGWTNEVVIQWAHRAIE